MKQNIIYEDNHLLVVNKPVNIPVQADSSNDLDLLTKLKQYLKDKYNKPGNVYLGLVHRLDRPVGGIMVFAKTSKAASRLSEQIRTKQFTKTYLAIVEGNLECNQGQFNDYLLKDEKTNMVKVDPRGKEAILNYKVIDRKDKYTLVEIDLVTGRSHQIRVQFSSRNFPLYGDQKYNKNAKIGEQIALLSYKLEFIHPTNNQKLVFKVDKPFSKIWNLFDNK